MTWETSPYGDLVIVDVSRARESVGYEPCRFSVVTLDRRCLRLQTQN